MAEKFIQEIGIKKGALSKQLGIPEEENIPIQLLNKIVRAEPGQTITNPTSKGRSKIRVTRLVERRAILALNLKKFKRWR